jgi:protein arginine N-methyltransferase 3
MSDSEGDDDCEGSHVIPQPCLCLFCSEFIQSTDQFFLHSQDHHSIDILAIQQRLKLDFYGWIKLINYIRKEQPSAHHVQSLCDSRQFEGDEYLVPIIPDDPLLQIDIDDDNEGHSDIITSDTDIQTKLKEMEYQLLLSREALDCSLRDLEQMKVTMRELTIDADDGHHCRNGGEQDEYFSSYSYYGIHEEMLKDQIRMESYHLFISRNAELFRDKVVLDVGCGTGILSMLALQSGASHVIAIDQSDVIYKAIEIAKENGYEEKITFIHGQVEDCVLPVDKVDVIISEWMGYFLLFESMMDTVLYARDKWLKDPRQVYPNHCSMSLVALGDDYEYQSKVNFWDNVEGFKMSCMKEDALKEPYITIVDEYGLISSSDVIKKFDLTSIKSCELDFEAKFSLTVTQDGHCNGLVGYFDVGFEVMTYRVYFSTSPQDTSTHWKQTVFFFKQPIKVKTGDLLRGTIKCCKNKSCHRSLDVTIRMKVLPLKQITEEDDETIIEQSYCLS